MNSSIKIQSAPPLGAPYIKVDLSFEGDDPRDQLLRHFFEQLNYSSNWLRTDYLPSEGLHQKINIFPVPSTLESLREQKERLEESIEFLSRKENEPQSQA